tara:strand:- start:65 stop:205 length:141 start_codon:yes stop_codon:yes gene_type:complete
MRIEVYIIPIFVLISVIALGIIIYIEERKDNKDDVIRQYRNKESKK